MEIKRILDFTSHWYYLLFLFYLIYRRTLGKSKFYKSFDPLKAKIKDIINSKGGMDNINGKNEEEEEESLSHVYHPTLKIIDLMI